MDHHQSHFGQLIKLGIKIWILLSKPLMKFMQNVNYRKSFSLLYHFLTVTNVQPNVPYIENLPQDYQNLINRIPKNYQNHKTRESKTQVVCMEMMKIKEHNENAVRR